MQNNYYKQWDEVIYSLGPLTITAGNVEQFCWKISVGITGFRFTSAIYTTDLHISESSNTNMNELWRVDLKRIENELRNA